MENQETMQNQSTQQTVPAAQNTPAAGAAPTKFCKNCGGKIAEKAVICPLCGCQVEEMHQGAPASAAAPQIIINNENTNSNVNMNGVGGRMKNKWVALLLCFFLGAFGIHRFYEGKIGSGILWLLTFGLFGVGVLIDFIIILCKPNPYYV